MGCIYLFKINIVSGGSYTNIAQILIHVNLQHYIEYSRIFRLSIPIFFWKLLSHLSYLFFNNKIRTETNKDWLIYGVERNETKRKLWGIFIFTNTVSLLPFCPSDYNLILLKWELFRRQFIVLWFISIFGAVKCWI